LIEDGTGLLSAAMLSPFLENKNFLGDFKRVTALKAVPEAGLAIFAGRMRAIRLFRITN
jgi:hypothetical protein